MDEGSRLHLPLSLILKGHRTMPCLVLFHLAASLLPLLQVVRRPSVLLPAGPFPTAVGVLEDSYLLELQVYVPGRPTGRSPEDFLLPHLEEDLARCCASHVSWFPEWDRCPPHGMVARPTGPRVCCAWGKRPIGSGHLAGLHGRGDLAPIAPG